MFVTFGLYTIYDHDFDTFYHGRKFPDTKFLETSRARASTRARTRVILIPPSHKLFHLDTISYILVIRIPLVVWVYSNPCIKVLRSPRYPFPRTSFNINLSQNLILFLGLPETHDALHMCNLLKFVNLTSVDEKLSTTTDTTHETLHTKQLKDRNTK